MIQSEKPAVVFLQETKSTNTAIERLFNKAWSGSQSVSTDAMGASGGLSMAWNPQILQLQDFHATRHFIQATFHLIGTDIHGHLTNTYFPQDQQLKLKALETLTSLNSSRRYPLWISGGDFNIITHLEEKKGGRRKLEEDSTSFKDFIRSNQLIDVQTSNGTYTWTNKRRGVHNIASRLDRFLLSDNAIHLGGDFHASILPQGGSDHWPIMLQWTRPGKHCNRPFRYEAFWSSHPNFKEVVQTAWRTFTPPEGAKMYKFQQKLRHLKQVLKAWNKNHFGNITESRQKLEQEMSILQQTIITAGRTEELADKEQSLWTALEARRSQEEILWRQKSRIKWLKEGEKNTKFFHRTTIQRRMHNNIAFINNSRGEKLERHEDMEKELRDHFQDMLKEPTRSRTAAIQEVTRHIPKLITADHNRNLLQPVSMQEVEDAMAQLKDGKAPGPDGFTSNFFHEFWDLIRSEV